MKEKNMYNMGGTPMFTMPVQSAGDNNQNGMMNNPFMYLVWMWAFTMFGRNGNGGLFGGGNEGAAAVTANQIDDIRSGVAALQQGVQCGDASIMRAIDQLADQARLNGAKICDINGNICDAKTAVLSGLCDLGHQLSTNTAAVLQTMNECCCSIKTELASGFCGVDKSILNQTNMLQGSLNGVNTTILQQTNTLAAGLSNLGFANQQQTCEIKQAIADQNSLIRQEGCDTRQLMRDLHTQDLLTQKDTAIANLTAQLSQCSQNAQTATIIAAVRNCCPEPPCCCPLGSTVGLGK